MRTLTWAASMICLVVVIAGANFRCGPNGCWPVVTRLAAPTVVAPAVTGEVVTWGGSTGQAVSYGSTGTVTTFGSTGSAALTFMTTPSYGRVRAFSRVSGGSNGNTSFRSRTVSRRFWR